MNMFLEGRCSSLKVKKAFTKDEEGYGFSLKTIKIV
jgi:hypothetical protein